MSQAQTDRDPYESDTVDAELSADAPPAGGTCRVSQWFVVLAAMGLVLIPVVWGSYPSEIARWHDAAAYEKYLEGDLPGAIADLDTALTWNDKSAARYRWRGEYRRESGEYEASLEDLNAALELAPADANLLMQRAITLQHFGRHADAVKDFGALLRQVSPQGTLDPALRPEMLNHLAYARAVGNIELAEGLAGAKEMIALSGGDAFVLEQVGYLHVLREDWRRAVTRLEEAEKMLAEKLADLKLEFAEARDKRSQEFTRAERKPFEKRLAAVQYHLGKAYRQLDQPGEAEKYEKLVAVWDESERSLKRKLPSPELAWRWAHNIALYLDTRGFLHFQLGNLDAARHDLELAYELAELEYLRPNRFDSYRKTVEDIRKHRRREEFMKRGVAVILYHRALVYEKMGLDTLAAEDFRRVKEEWGQTPDEHLF